MRCWRITSIAIRAFLCSAVSLPGCSAASLKPSAELDARPLVQGVWLIVHEVPFQSNSLLVEMEDGALVLVHTPYTEAETRSLLRWIRRVHGPRRIVAINTHFHWDSLGGNGALIEAGVPVYGSDRTVALLRERGERMRSMMVDWLKDKPEIQERFRKASLVAPTRVFPLVEGLTLTFASEEVRVIYPGAAHSPDNVVVFFPKRKLLFGGCMVLAGDKVGNRSDADLDSWPDAIRVLERLDADVVIPGHGHPGNRTLLKHTLDLLERTK